MTMLISDLLLSEHERQQGRLVAKDYLRRVCLSKT